MVGYWDMRTQDLFSFIDDGQRAYRLRRTLDDCPAFEDEVFRKAWRAGFIGATYGRSVQTILNELIRELGDYCGPMKS